MIGLLRKAQARLRPDNRQVLVPQRHSIDGRDDLADALVPVDEGESAADFFLACGQRRGIVDEMADLFQPGLEVVRVEQFGQVRRDFRRRCAAGGKADLAIGEALGNRQAPALIQGRVQGEFAVAVEPVKLLVVDILQELHLAGQLRLARNQFHDLFAAPHVPSDQEELRCAVAALLDQTAPDIDQQDVVLSEIERTHIDDEFLILQRGAGVATVQKVIAEFSLFGTNISQTEFLDRLQVLALRGQVRRQVTYRAVGIGQEGIGAIHHVGKVLHEHVGHVGRVEMPGGILNNVVDQQGEVEPARDLQLAQRRDEIGIADPGAAEHQDTSGLDGLGIEPHGLSGRLELGQVFGIATGQRISDAQPEIIVGLGIPDNRHDAGAIDAEQGSKGLFLNAGDAGWMTGMVPGRRQVDIDLAVAGGDGGKGACGRIMCRNRLVIDLGGFLHMLGPGELLAGELLALLAQGLVASFADRGVQRGDQPVEIGRVHITAQVAEILFFGGPVAQHEWRACRAGFQSGQRRALRPARQAEG